MTKLITSLLTAVLLVAGFTGFANAMCQGKAHEIQHPGQGYGQGQGYGKGYGQGYGQGRYRNYDKDAMAKALNLTEAQRAEVEEIWTKVQKESITLHAEMQKIGIDIGSALSGNEPDFMAAKMAFKKLGKLRSKIHDNYFDALEATYELLTPDQKKNWGKAMENFQNPPASAKDCPLKGTKECPLSKQQGA